MSIINKKYHKLPPRTAFIIIAAAALLVFLIGIGIWRLSGAHNTTLVLSNGDQVKFTGLFDSEGKPISGTLYYSNGLSAEIDVENGKVTYSDGTVYIGTLDHDYRRTGKGTITWQNGDSYTGDFVADMLTGSGVFTFASGDVYEGELVGGKKQGNGKYTSSDGSVYEGCFKDDRRHGTGKLVSPDGAVYEGEFANGLKSGYGHYSYSNGDSYEGEFKGDLRHGDGKYIWANGETYTGEFANGTMNGFGTYTWPEGRASYTGYFKDGVIVVIEPN